MPGIGEKTATQLLQDYKTLDGVYENLWQVKDSVRKKLETGKESAYMSKKTRCTLVGCTSATGSRADGRAPRSKPSQNY
ncbi:hypothetical protein IPL68_03285 [Candidatus Saccharibacteria bacterium]|nr:MAG: hypothetical protein IPL68_03285 [Candidatus Saccharibacteria bacterium]